MEQLEQLIKKANYYIRHYDDFEAKKILKQLEKFVVSQDIKAMGTEQQQQIQKTIIFLKIVAIPQLAEKETTEVLKNYYLNSFDAEIDMENRLTARLFYVPEIPRDDLRRKLKKALTENKQNLGGLTIGQWIQEFEKQYDVRTRNLSAEVDFVRSNKNAFSLNAIEKNRLKEILHVYDYLLVTTLPVTGPALKDILSMASLGKMALGNNTQSYQKDLSQQNDNRSHANKQETKVEILAFSQALKNFPDLGEQLITSNKIKLKNFPDEVRPSIKNWLSDYTFNAGHETHDSMKRGTYLFQNENAKILNAEDRKKLAFILGTFDANSTVTVNTNLKQIVFPVRAEVPRPSSRPNSEINLQRRTANAPVFPSRKIESMQKPQSLGNKPIPNLAHNLERKPFNTDLRKETERSFSRPAPVSNHQTKKNIQDSSSEPSRKMVFSSPQRFSNEAPEKAKENPPVQPQPIRITPRGFQREVGEQTLPKKDVAMKNVVNLKE